MKITIENTSRIVEVNGVPCRQWEGTTASGIPVQCLITRIAVHNNYDQAQFEAELQQQKAPTVPEAFPLRMVL